MLSLLIIGCSSQPLPKDIHVLDEVSNETLNTVGGWHSDFIKYCRFGHTEHSYRCYNRKMSPAPFVTIKEVEKDICYAPLKTHYDSFKDLKNKLHQKLLKVNRNRVVLVEQDIIDKKLNYFPFNTPSDFKVIEY